MTRKMFALWTAILLLQMTGFVVHAQVTNVPSSVASTVAAGAGPAFDTGIVIAAAAAAIIFALRYVRKALGR